MPLCSYYWGTMLPLLLLLSGGQLYLVRWLFFLVALALLLLSVVGLLRTDARSRNRRHLRQELLNLVSDWNLRLSNEEMKIAVSAMSVKPNARPWGETSVEYAKRLLTTAAKQAKASLNFNVMRSFIVDMFLVLGALMALVVASVVYGHGQNSPDAPSNTWCAERVGDVMTLSRGACPTVPVYRTPTAGFFKFRPMRSNEEVLSSRTFLWAHAVELGANIADAEMTHAGIAHHKCIEANGPAYPSRGHLYRYDLIPLALTTGLDFVLDKYAWRPLSLVAPAIGTVNHIKGALSWTGSCW
jgi:hypothetical protein